MQASNHSRAGENGKLPVEQLSTEELEALLRAHAEQEPDEQWICAIMEVIQKREAEQQQLDVDAAWQTFCQDYQGKVQHYTRDAVSIRKNCGRRSVLRKLVIGFAAVLLFCGVTFASEENLFQFIANSTNETLRFVEQYEQKEIYNEDYGPFEKLHEIVSEYSDTTVVPTWAPDGTEQFGEIKVTNRSNSIGILGTFQCTECQFTISIKIFDSIPAFDKNAYEKDSNDIYSYEINQIDHYIFKNNDQYAAVWVNDTIIVFIQGEVDKKTLMDIISSIYLE